MKISCIAVDYGGTLDAPDGTVDPALGMRPIDPLAVDALRSWHAAGVRLVLASNTRPEQDRWEALRAAGVAGLFSVVLQSSHINVAKPGLIFYRLVVAAAGCSPERILFVGNDLVADVAEPMRHGMHAVLVRAHGLAAGEIQPMGAGLVRHVEGLCVGDGGEVRVVRDGRVPPVSPEPAAGLVSAPSSPRKRTAARTIADELIGLILAGDYGVADRLPGEARLKARFGVAGMTARSAVAILRAEGWVITHPNKGSFVARKESWPLDWRVRAEGVG